MECIGLTDDARAVDARIERVVQVGWVHWFENEPSKRILTYEHPFHDDSFLYDWDRKFNAVVRRLYLLAKPGKETPE
jgi:hypothetical protein